MPRPDTGQPDGGERDSGEPRPDTGQPDGGETDSGEPPPTYELQVRRGGTSLLPEGVRDTQAFIFRRDGDRVIAVDGGDTMSFWSDDGGNTWTPGPKGPATFEMKSAIDLGNNEILSFTQGTSLRPDGRYDLRMFRSLDGWRTTEVEAASVDTPEAVPLTTDGGNLAPDTGLRLHHGMERLSDGRLIATMYGTYAEDREIVEGGDAECQQAFESWGFRKFRVVVVFSEDEGCTWDDPVTVASYHMVEPPSLVTEGFNESDLLLMETGELLLVMRTGGRNNDCNGYPSSPLYTSRSTDQGRTWSTPTPIDAVGSNPNLVALPNGAVVLGFGRPGGHLLFSGDQGRTWTNPIALTTADQYTDLLPMASDKVLALYFNEERRVEATIYQVETR